MSTAAPTLAVGAVFAREFRVVRPLAKGGMGAVYVVEQVSTGKERALKVMHPELVQDPASRARFEQEARISARIDSEHVVEVLGAGVDEETGSPWLAMELLRGETLAESLARRGAMDGATALALFKQLGSALAAAHATGVVHRDLKPENLFLAQSKRADEPFVLKVLDFGIAKVIAASRTAATTASAVGSPLWMAPEQANAEPVRPATDVWALGLLVYLVLVGAVYWRHPRRATGTMQSLLVEILIDPLEPASVRAAELQRAERIPPGFDAWFARCVVRPPEARFANGGDAIAALERVFTGQWSPDALKATHWTPPPASAWGPVSVPPPQQGHAPVSAPAQVNPQGHTPQHAHSPHGQHTPPVMPRTRMSLGPAVPYAPGATPPFTPPHAQWTPGASTGPAQFYGPSPTGPAPAKKTGFYGWLLRGTAVVLAVVVVIAARDLLDLRHNEHDDERIARTDDPPPSAAPSVFAPTALPTTLASALPAIPIAPPLAPPTSAPPPIASATSTRPAPVVRASAPHAPSSVLARTTAAPPAPSTAPMVPEPRATAGFVRPPSPSPSAAAMAPAPAPTPAPAPAGSTRETTAEERRALLHVMAPLIERCWLEAQRRMTPPIETQELTVNLHINADGYPTLALARGPDDGRLTRCIEQSISDARYPSIGSGLRLYSSMRLTPD